MPNDWEVVEGTGWIDMPGFGRINPRRDNVGGGREYFSLLTSQTENDESPEVAGDAITGGPETWFYSPDLPFLMRDRIGNCVEAMISVLPGGRYAVKYRVGEWDYGHEAGW